MGLFSLISESMVMVSLFLTYSVREISNEVSLSYCLASSSDVERRILELSDISFPY